MGTVAHKVAAYTFLLSFFSIKENARTRIIPPPVPTRPLIPPAKKASREKINKEPTLVDNNFLNINAPKIFYFCQKYIVFSICFCYDIIIHTDINIILRCFSHKNSGNFYYGTCAEKGSLMKKRNDRKYRKKKKGNGTIRKTINKLMPYILSVFAAVVLFSLSGLAGGFGNGMRSFFYGVFSNFATYFLPIFLIYHAIMWNYDVQRKICVRRVVCTFITLICFSTMQYLIQVTDYVALNSFSVSTFYTMGKESLGGGFVGGVFGKLLLGMSSILGVVIITLVLVFMILQMFNITPAYMVRSMLKNKKPKAKKAVAVKPKGEKRVKPISPRKIKVIEDDDSIEVDTSDAFMNTTRVIPIDDICEDEDRYKDLNVREINARTEYIPSQLQPFENNDFTVSTSKYSEEEEEDIDGELDDEEELIPDVVEETYAPIVEDVPPVSEELSEPYEVIDEAEEQEAYFEDEVGYDFEAEDAPCAEDDYEEEPLFEPKEETYISSEILNKVADSAKTELKVVNTVFEPEEKKEERRIVKEPRPKINYMLPPLYFLKSQPDNSDSDEIRAELQENAKIIVETLNDFKAPTRIVDVTRGPTITRYELQPEKGVRVSKIESLVNDIALNLAAKGIRIECPIPGKNAIGIEVPNRKISFVYLRDLIADPRFERAESKLTCSLGKSIAGDNIYVDIESTPHLLVAGATGMGKSVCINSLLVSLLYKAKPDEVRLILIDPKRVELSNYNGIPHLLVPVVCEPKKSLGALQWAVTEMENRFMAIEDAGVRNIKEYNQRVEKGYAGEKMARIVIVIDELADLKMAVPDIEGHITRLTQKARAAGIHVIIGTQRPSVDVLTGLIKNNIPSRIAFRVPSQIDSRTILDETGAEKLVSKGDMLVKLVGALNPIRVQGAYVGVDEIQDVIDFWKDSGPANYDEEVMQQIDNNAAKLSKNDKDDFDGEDASGEELDSEFYNALEIAVELGKISSSLLMRKLSLGFGRASRVIDQMESLGYVGEANGPKPREVLITKEMYQEIMMRRNDE